MNEQDLERVRFALSETFDTGNAVPEAIDELLIKMDSFEFEQALMGVPEPGNPTLPDFMDKLREIYVAKVLSQLDSEYEKYGDSSQ